MAAERIFIGLGSNQGDSLGCLLAAVEAMQAWRERLGLNLAGLSSLYRSAPWQTAGPDFLNAVAVVEGNVAPMAMLAELQALEQAAGRVRPYRYAPRTLDLDLLLHGHRIIDTDVLTVPHPRALERAFVLCPLQELAPDLIWPGVGQGWRRQALEVGQDKDQRVERIHEPAWPARVAPRRIEDGSSGA